MQLELRRSSSAIYNITCITGYEAKNRSFSVKKGKRKEKDQ